MNVLKSFKSNRRHATCSSTVKLTIFLFVLGTCGLCVRTKFIQHDAAPSTAYGHGREKGNTFFYCTFLLNTCDNHKVNYNV